jgi:predicted negative regulator of RcsB-dependent stress response
MASKSDQPPADERIYDVGSFEAELFWQKNRSAILFGGAILLAIAAALVIWLFSQHGARRAAETLFAEAQDSDAWRALIAKYPNSIPAANAYFLLADSLRAQGELDESSALYEKFLTTFPAHPLAGGARLGLAENLAVAGKTDEALAALREVQTKGSAGYAAPFAALLEGRILVRLGKLDEARKVLANLVAAYPQSPAGRAAGAQLDALAPVLPPDPQKAAH